MLKIEVKGFGVGSLVLEIPSSPNLFVSIPTNTKFKA